MGIEVAIIWFAGVVNVHAKSPLILRMTCGGLHGVSFSQGPCTQSLGTWIAVVTNVVPTGLK